MHLNYKYTTRLLMPLTY